MGPRGFEAGGASVDCSNAAPGGSASQLGFAGSMLATRLAGEFTPLGEKLGVLGCLIDIRGTTSESSASDKYMFAYEKAKDTGLPRHWRVAILKDHGDDSPDLIWTAMENAGYIIQIFEDEREAIDWIKEHRPANKPDAGDA